MSQPVPAVAAAALLLLLAARAEAEPDDSRLIHPADTSRPSTPQDTIDPFDFAVPLLSRELPAPSYAPPSAQSPAPAADAEPDAMPGMDHGSMDHGNISH